MALLYKTEEYLHEEIAFESSIEGRAPDRILDFDWHRAEMDGYWPYVLPRVLDFDKDAIKDFIGEDSYEKVLIRSYVSDAGVMHTAVVVWDA